jgi:hypothetical protein
VNQEKLGRATGANPEDPDEAVVLAALGATTIDSGSEAEQASKAPQKIETVDERLTRYRDMGTPLPDLTRDYGLPELGNVKVSAIAVVEGSVLDSTGQDTPVWLSPGPGGTATCIVDLNHPAFRKFGADISVYLLIEVASFLKLKTSASSLTTSQIVSRLQTVCLPDTAVDSNVIEGEARELLTELRQRMANQVNLNPQRALQHLTPDETDYMENSVIADGGSTLDLGKDGSFLLYVPPLFLVKLLEEWPEAFMDGHVFGGLFASLSSPSSRRLSLARVVGYLNDIATLLSFQTTPGTLNLQRTRLSVHLLIDELAPDS